jgi:putative ABC transport system substrate-binding protein
MRRRDFITLVSSAAAWPLAAHAQSATPVVGFVNAADAPSYKQQVAAFLKGLEDTGYIAGKNVTIEYRWAEERNDRLAAMLGDLVHRQVAVIAATSTPAAVAAKAATTVVPVIFETGADPIR